MPNIDGPYTRENADLRAQVAVLEVMLKRLQYSNSCACPICGEKQNDWGAHRLDCQLDRILSSTPSETRKLEAELDAEVKESIRLNIRLALADKLAEAVAKLPITGGPVWDALWEYRHANSA